MGICYFYEKDGNLKNVGGEDNTYLFPLKNNDGTVEGFVVYKGAIINSTPAKSISPGALKLRDQLITEGKVKDWKTTEDILFSSSSLAAGFVLGYSASGPKNWKAQDGRTLKEIEESKTSSL